MEKTKLTFVVTTMVTLTLCLVIICMVATLMVGLFDTTVDNAEIFKLISPAFQTVIGGFIGLLAGIKLKNEDEGATKSDQMQLLHWQILSLEKKIEEQNKNKE
jgi:undecaprenyl pyrophosphate phosphatase UppP